MCLHGSYERTGFRRSKLRREHINHERLINILQASKPVKDILKLSGKAFIEIGLSRVLVGKFP
jgi:hypothetical protein